MIVVLPSLILTFQDVVSHEPELVGDHEVGEDHPREGLIAKCNKRLQEVRS